MNPPTDISSPQFHPDALWVLKTFGVLAMTVIQVASNGMFAIELPTIRTVSPTFMPTALPVARFSPYPQDRKYALELAVAPGIVTMSLLLSLLTYRHIDPCKPQLANAYGGFVEL